MAKARQIEITDHSVGALPLVERGPEREYRDAVLKGFSVRVTRRSKTFTFRADHWSDGRRVGSRRVTIGRVGEIPAEAAREKARAMKRHLGTTGSPALPPSPATAKQITFGDAWTKYKEHLVRDKKSVRTIAEYEHKVVRHLSDWLERPLAEITRQDAMDKHAAITERRTVVGRPSPAGAGRARATAPYAANGALRVARAVWSFAQDDLEVPGLSERNPFRSRRLFHRETPKAGGMASHELAAWAAQLAQLPPMRQLFHTWFLLSGMREDTVCNMRWQYVDLGARNLQIPQPKGGKPMEIPLSRAMVACLRLAWRRNGEHFLPEGGRTAPIPSLGPGWEKS
ncbi:MAG TPA: integrase arm-type DNA-binding domain-containing protein, partial [Xanthobacteraceae bacterium]